jgi:hypothetical protein
MTMADAESVFSCALKLLYLSFHEQAQLLCLSFRDFGEKYVRIMPPYMEMVFHMPLWQHNRTVPLCSATLFTAYGFPAGF